MRQRQLLELLKDYDMSIKHHPGKANVVADALCRRAMPSLSLMITLQMPLLEQLRWLEIEVVSLGDSARLMSLVL